MASANWDIMVIILDCGKSMQLSCPSGNSKKAFECKRKFDIAKDFVAKVILRRMALHPRNEVGIVCINSFYQPSFSSKIPLIEGVSLFSDIGFADFSLLQQLEHLQPSEIDEDPLKGLDFALELIQRQCVNKKIRKQLVLVIPDALKSEEKLLYNNFNRRMQALEVNLMVIQLENSAICSTLNDMPLTTPQNVCANLGATYAISSNAEDALRCLEFRRNYSVKRVSTMLCVAPSMRIPVEMYLRTKVSSLSTLRRVSLPGLSTEAEGAINMHRTHFRPSDPMKSVIGSMDKAKAYRYGKKLVPFSSLEASLFKVETMPGITVLCVVKISQILRHWLVDCVECILAARYNKSATAALGNLVHALRQRKEALLCRYVWRKNAAPRLAAVFPSKSGKRCSLTLVYIPFFEDLQSLNLEAMPLLENEPLNSISRLIEILQLDREIAMSAVGDELSALNSWCKKTQHLITMFNPLVCAIQNYFVGKLLGGETVYKASTISEVNFSLPRQMKELSEIHKVLHSNFSLESIENVKNEMAETSLHTLHSKKAAEVAVSVKAIEIVDND